MRQLKEDYKFVSSAKKQTPIPNALRKKLPIEEQIEQVRKLKDLE